MTINVSELRERLRASADAAAQLSKEQRARGFDSDADFAMGRQAAFVTALRFLDEAEDAKAHEVEQDDRRYKLLGEDHVLNRLGRGQGVDLAAMARLEEFVREAGGAVDEASGTVYSDADEGL